MESSTDSLSFSEQQLTNELVRLFSDAQQVVKFATVWPSSPYPDLRTNGAPLHIGYDLYIIVSRNLPKQLCQNSENMRMQNAELRHAKPNGERTA